MTIRTTLQRTLAVTLIASTCLLALAPLAEAGHGPKRYKHRARWDRHTTRVVVRESSAAPLVAGLIGGFLLGTAVSDAHAAPVVVHERRVVDAPRYRYFDPYCDRWFSELSSCREHCWNDRHPAVVKVYDVRRGDCVRTMRWYDGAWYDTGDRDWDGRHDRGDWDDDRDWRD